MVLQHVMRLKNENFGFCKKLYKNFSSLTFCVKKSFLGKAVIAVVNNFLFYVFLVLLSAFCLKSLFLVIFQTYINFRPKMA